MATSLSGIDALVVAGAIGGLTDLSSLTVLAADLIVPDFRPGISNLTSVPAKSSGQT